jgi:toxin CptA
MFGIIPLFQGPIATAMGGIDLSWLAGGLSSSILYYLLGRKYALRYRSTQARMVFETSRPKAGLAKITK